MSALPWRPIGELQCAPNPNREFVITGCVDDSSCIVRWDSVRGHWKARDEGLYDSHVRKDFTHFIEITPPDAAPTR